jgi:hypothetical protein
MEENVVYDVQGYDLLTPAIYDLLNSYPGLEKNEKVSFSQLNESHGKAMFPSTGAIVQYQKESITGHVEKRCLYPFTFVYRASGLTQSRKVNAKEWLETLGKWLEKQTVSIGGQNYKIQEYPVLNSLDGDAEIEEIARQTPAYLAQTNGDMSEDWVMTVQAHYRIEYDT